MPRPSLMKTTIKPRIKTIPATHSSPSMRRKLLSLSVSMVDFNQKPKRSAAYDFVIVFNEEYIQTTAKTLINKRNTSEFFNIPDIYSLRNSTYPMTICRYNARVKL